MAEVPLPSKPDTTVYRDLPVQSFFEWDVSSILTALAEHELGQFWGAAILSDYLLRDDRVSACLGTRVNGVLGLPFSIEPSPDGDRRKGGKVVRALEQAWPRILKRNQLGEFIRWGRMMGFAIGELVWDTTGELWEPRVKVWHPAHCYYRTDTRRFYVNTMDGPVEITPGDGKWILYTPHGEYRGWMHGAVRSVGIVTLIRQFCYRDSGRACEMYGLGVRVGKIPAQASTVDKARFLAMLRNLASDSVITLPQYQDKDGKPIGFDFDIRAITAGQGAAKLFETVAARCDSAIALTFLGQNLTTEVKEGSLAAARVHGDVRQDYLEADVATASDDIREQILRPWAAFNFGDPDAAPMPMWDTRPEEDKSAGAKTLLDVSVALTNFANLSMGEAIDLAVLAERFGIPLKPAADVVPAPLPDAVAPMKSSTVSLSGIRWRKHAWTAELHAA